ncbi:hypothetical protein COY28_06000, partial [Candidatus Woesearchaeota archaeon CG_4_10_14_0_2_um_filter_57_5]
QVSLIAPRDGRATSSPQVGLLYNATIAADNCSLILDQQLNRTNTSITANTTLSFNLSLSIGPHNWSVNCTTTSGTGNSSTWNLTVFEVSFAFDGNTTDLSNVSDLANVSNLTIDKSGSGTIQFTEPVNLTGGINFTAAVIIQDNLVSIDSAAVPQLNRSASIALRNLPFVNPVAKRDGQLCPASICIARSYDGSNLNVSVTGFSNYSAAEEANLSIWDTTESAPASVDANITFYANFTNITSGLPINGTDIWCEIQFNSTADPWFGLTNMTYDNNSAIYNYTTNFSASGFFNVRCNGTALAHPVINVTDTFSVLNDPPTITNLTGILPVPAYNTTSLNYTFMVSDSSDDIVTVQVNWTNHTQDIVYQETLVSTTPANITVNLSSTNLTSRT